MAIGLTEDQQALAEAVADWSRSRGTVELVRRTEQAGQQELTALWPELAKLGVPGIGVPEAAGGAGGTLVDVACALEACAEALVPGPLLCTTVVATLLSECAGHPVAAQLLPAIVDGSATVALAPEPAELDRGQHGRLTGTVPVWDAGTTTHLLVGVGRGGDAEWHLLTVDDSVEVQPTKAVDLSRGLGRMRLTDTAVGTATRVPLDATRVADVAVTLAAAEASGVARWALRTAVEHARVREQFGRPIGSFQAVKHLCAQMLERAESATAVAWDAATAYADSAEQHRLSAAVAGAVALDAAVDCAKDCIQVLGGIGFTWEHDAHLYLRRALVLRQLLGGADRWRQRAADLALTGTRRVVHVDLGGRGEGIRERVRDEVARAARLEGSARRTALADAGLIAPHWPAPYGLGADAAEQLVIDEELATAGVPRPELAVGAWAVPTILGHGDDAQRERFVGPTLRGEIGWCQLFSEPGAGSDLASLRTRAERVDGGWRLTGQKVWTSLAREADWAICLARTDPDAPRHRGITYFLVDMRSDGIDVRPLRELTGEAVFNEVFLDGVLVPDDCVVGEVGGGWKLARTTLANERVAMSGSSLGVSVERALDTVAALGTPDAGVRLKVGAAVADASAVKALGTRAMLRSVAGQGPGAESSVQKLVGVQQRQDAAELAVELLGPEALLGGEVADAALHELLLTRCLSIAGGTTQILRNVAAERILGLPREPAG